MKHLIEFKFFPSIAINISLHGTAIHFTDLHYTDLYYTSLHFTAKYFDYIPFTVLYFTLRKFTKFTALHSLHYIHCTTFSALHSVHYIQCTTFSALYSLHYIHCTALQLSSNHCIVYSIHCFTVVLIKKNNNILFQKQTLFCQDGWCRGVK